MLGPMGYEEVLLEIAQTVDMSRSSVRREAVQDTAEQLKSQREKHWGYRDCCALDPC